MSTIAKCKILTFSWQKFCASANLPDVSSISDSWGGSAETSNNTVSNPIFERLKSFKGQLSISTKIDSSSLHIKNGIAK
jgi:hypothetical protein